MLIKNYKKKLLLYCIFLCTIALLISGCARWPDDPNGGGGTGEKQLTVKVEINNDGQINTTDGKYYIVFDTNEDAAFPPDKDLNNWDDGFYYTRLDIFGFRFGEVGGTERILSGSAQEGDNYFQVTVTLAELGNPEKIFMNVITTDTDNDTYDYLEMGPALDLTINTSIIPSSNSVEDDLGDSANGLDYDIYRVTTILSTP